MDVTAITKARAIAFMELDALAKGGKVRFSDCIQPLVERYDFKRFPTKPEDFDLDQSGVRFESGKIEGLLIDSLTIYSGAFVLDTLSSTNDSKAMLLDLFTWGSTELGLSYEEPLIRRWGYISDIVFQSDIALLELQSTPLQKLAAKTSDFTKQIFDGLEYVPSEVRIGHDPAVRQHAIASLQIAHRTNTLFSDNIFFSEAPLPTHLHLQFLSEFEQDVKMLIR